MCSSSGGNIVFVSSVAGYTLFPVCCYNFKQLYDDLYLVYLGYQCIWSYENSIIGFDKGDGRQLRKT
jgi:hypothetical protein